jgi:hypothetical protein
MIRAAINPPTPKKRKEKKPKVNVPVTAAIEEIKALLADGVRHQLVPAGYEPKQECPDLLRFLKFLRRGKKRQGRDARRVGQSAWKGTKTKAVKVDMSDPMVQMRAIAAGIRTPRP